MHAVNVYVPYDDWPSHQNQVWVMPVGGPTFTPQAIPVPDDEIGRNPSCAFMGLTASLAPAVASYAYARMCPHKGRTRTSRES